MSNNYQGLPVANPKVSWQNYGGYWLNDWVNYQWLFGRARPRYPQVNFMEIFAQKKAELLEKKKLEEEKQKLTVLTK